jgi:hypothetical protein
MIDGLAALLVFDFAVAGTAEIIGEIVAPQESETALRLLAAGYHYDRGDSPVQSPPNVVATREGFAALAVDVQLPAKVLYWKYPVSLPTERVEDLLHPTHPLERLHQQQVQQLRVLPATERASQAQLLRIGNAAYRYHQLAQDRLTEADFAHWLVGLPTRLQQAMATAGFEAARSSWAFRRHVLERHDVGYAAFMQELLSPEDWTFCQEQEPQDPAS